MLDLVRLSPRRLFPPGGVELYRQITLLTEMSTEHEVLGVACGKGVSLEYFVKEHGVTASGVAVWFERVRAGSVGWLHIWLYGSYRPRDPRQAATRWGLAKANQLGLLLKPTDSLRTLPLGAGL